MHKCGPPQEREVYTIGELSALYKVSYKTLRFYEERGLLQPRRIGRERFFTEHDECRLNLIIKAKRFGFSLVEIRALLESRGHMLGLPNEAGMGLSKREIEIQLEMLDLRRALVTEAINELQGLLGEPRSS